MKEIALFREVHVIKCDDYSWMMLLETCADVATYLMSTKFIPWICIGIKNSGTSTPRVLLVHTMFYMSLSHKDLWITQVIENYIQVALHYPQVTMNYTQVTMRCTHRQLRIIHTSFSELQTDCTSWHISCLRKLPEKHQKHIQHKKMQYAFHASSNLGYNLNQFRMSPQNLTCFLIYIS